MVQLQLPEIRTPVNLVYTGEPKMTVDEFYQFCQVNPDLWFELTVDGDIVILPPAGPVAGFRSGEVFGQLREWARKNLGFVFDASSGFALPDGSVRAADAAWVARERIQGLTTEQKERFIPLAPDFVVEVMSRTDRLNAAKSKMAAWMRNGVSIGLLIDPCSQAQTLYVYHDAVSDPDTFRSIDSLCLPDPVRGFLLDLAPVWRGL